MRLNEEQEAAVQLRNGPALILAGPGSGKTAVITSRTHQLISKYKIPAGNILVVTFSRKAAESMKARFLSMHKGTGLPFFGTFHSIFFMILKQAYNLNPKNIITEKQKLAFIREETEKRNLTSEETEDLFLSLLDEISCIKSGSGQIESFSSSVVGAKDFRAIYAGYCQSLSRSGLIDFDDMLSLTLSLLKERPDILSYWQNCFRYILIDEFQDINPIQYEIIRLLALPENNLFIVGDDDQSIYAFRGAQPSIMRRFLKDFPKAKKITLQKNYRCHPKIQRASLRVIEENKNRFPKALKSAVPDSAPGKVQILRFSDQFDEYAYLADQILKKLKDGVPPEEIAILVRSSRDLPLLSSFLESRDLPAPRFVPSVDPFRNFIWEDISAYLRLAENYAGSALPRDRLETDLFRVINRPSRFITRHALEQAFLSGAENCREALSFLEKWYQKNPEKKKAVRKLAEDLKMLHKCTPYAAVKYLRSVMHYEDCLSDQAETYRKTKAEYLDLLDRIEASLKNGISPSDPEQPGQKPESRDPKEASSIRLMTMHASKGLEFSYVYLTDLNEGYLPVKQAKTPAQIEEERRIFYVAMTRASRSLVICFCEKMRNKKAAPSRFLDCFLSR